MNIDREKQSLFKLTETSGRVRSKGGVITPGRILVGRSESCGMSIGSDSVSAVHAVFECSEKGSKLYDLNSRHGTFVNSKKIISQDIKKGDLIRFGSVEFVFEEYQSSSDLPPIMQPVLETLEPETGAGAVRQPPSIKKVEEAAPSLPQTPTTVQVNDEAPYVVYPLGDDKKADYSEYIFEETTQLKPIFKYDVTKQAVEVIILFRDQVYSVDFLTENKTPYKMVGSQPKKKEMEFAYLGKEEKVNFVLVSSDSCLVTIPHNYNVMHIKKDKVEDNTQGDVTLFDDDIVRLSKGEIEIYVRRVPAPPKVKAAPFFREDKEFWKYILIVLFSIFFIVGASFLISPEKEEEEEKDPDRVARILYKQPLRQSKFKAVEKTAKKKPVKQKTNQKVVKKKQPPKPKPPTKKKVVKKDTKTAGSKTAAKVQKVKKVNKPKPKSANKLATASASKANTKSANTKRANRPSPNKGMIDVYKSANFKSTVSALMAKGGSMRGATTAATSNSGITGASIGGGVATNLKKAAIGTEVGSLAGSASGKLAESKGTGGLATDTGAYVAGVAGETVVLGSMDPDDVRRILREHIPQFRYCYQKALDSSTNKQGFKVKLNFAIGASGSVTNAAITGSNMPSASRRCAVNVLRGIKFPAPLGGGKADVSQPFNFYPENI